MHYTIYLNMNPRRLNKNDSDAMQEYTKRLSAYCKINQFCKPAPNISAILSTLKDSAHTLYVQIQPGHNTLSSEQLADSINQFRIHGISTICFFIGYHNEEEPVLSDSHKTLSLSAMDITTGLTGVLLYEQLYRSYRILNHQPYHK